MKYPKEVYWYGSDIKLSQKKFLQAGPLTVIYENGNLRYIRLGNHEVLRMIYAAVRDHNWGTIPGKITNEEIEVKENAFLISYQCHYQQQDINFVANYSIEGKQDGTIIFSMSGEALSTFRKNRIGFCILHPVKECAGKACTIDKVDGSTEEGHFPENISPHQPFKNMKGIKWPLIDQLEAKISFSGDTFEMEDQRNWTDASYKTYSTPLDIPFPVEVQVGTKINQEVILELLGSTANIKIPNQDDVVKLTLTDHQVPFPDLGIARSSERDLLRKGEMERIRDISFNHYRVDIKLFEPSWRNIFRNATEEYINFRYPLELILHFGNDITREVNEFINIAKELSPYIKTFTIFHRDTKTTQSSLLNAVVPVLREKFPNIKIGAGTDAYFTELNRERTPTELIDFLSYSINPQVHAFDNDSLTETLEAQAYTVASAIAMANGIPVHVSPVTFRPRFNPNATGPEPPPAPGQLPGQVDQRQTSLYGAGWTLGSIKYLAEAGAGSLTYFETIGRRGIVQGEFPPELPDQFKAERKAVFPMYHVFSSIVNYKPDKVQVVKSSQPLLIDALMIMKGSERRLMLANYTAHIQKVEIPWWREQLRKRTLSDKNVESFCYNHRKLEFEPVSKSNRTGKLKLEIPAFGILTLE